MAAVTLRRAIPRESVTLAERSEKLSEAGCPAPTEEHRRTPPFTEHSPRQPHRAVAIQVRNDDDQVGVLDKPLERANPTGPHSSVVKERLVTYRLRQLAEERLAAIESPNDTDAHDRLPS
jgi:hypothetical protein